MKFLDDDFKFYKDMGSAFTGTRLVRYKVAGYILFEKKGVLMVLPKIEINRTWCTCSLYWAIVEPCILLVGGDIILPAVANFTTKVVFL